MLHTLWCRLIDPRAKMSRHRGQSAPRCRCSRTCRPSLEFLEDRLTPATFFVVNSSDNLLPGSLRQALTQANLDPGSTIAITAQVTRPINLTQGELPILANLTIRNDSGAALAIQQRLANARVFHVSGSAALNVTIAGGPSSPLRLTGGSSRGGNGGGILVD
jgi:hypothetical protein